MPELADFFPGGVVRGKTVAEGAEL